MYWQKGAECTLESLDPSNFLHTQLASCFTLTNSPVWMDSSTTQYCRRLEEAVGGAEVGQFINLYTRSQLFETVEILFFVFCLARS